jgi:uncharacterized protein involved in outer membrane biogenesis
MIRFTSRLLLFLLQLMAFLAILFFGVLYLQTETVDGDDFRALVRDALSRQTGRAVTVGSVDVSFSWPPRIVIRNLRIANRRGGSKRPMLVVRRIHADLNPYHLLVGGRTVSRLVFERPDILVERGRDGNLNWRRGPARALAFVARQARAGRVVISGGRLTVRDLRRGGTTVVPFDLVDIEPGVRLVRPAAGR